MGKPAEPYAIPGQLGRVLVAKPGKGKSLPAQAYVEWDDFYTWERCADLQLPEAVSWDEVRKVLSRQEDW